MTPYKMENKNDRHQSGPSSVCSRPYSVKSTAAVHHYKPMSTYTHTEDIDHIRSRYWKEGGAEEAGQKAEIFA